MQVFEPRSSKPSFRQKYFFDIFLFLFLIFPLVEIFDGCVHDTYMSCIQKYTSQESIVVEIEVVVKT